MPRENIDLHEPALPFTSLLRKPSAFLPLAMSLTAIVTIVVTVATQGTAPQADEGTAAHIWQFLMGSQLPIIVLFAITQMQRSPRAAGQVLALQVAAAVCAAAPVFIFGW